MGILKNTATSARNNAASKVGMKNMCECGCGRPCKKQFATIACSKKVAESYKSKDS